MKIIKRISSDCLEVVFKDGKPLRVYPNHDWWHVFIRLADLEEKAERGLCIAQTIERNRDMYNEACLKYNKTKDERYYYKMKRLDKEYVELKSYLRSIEEINNNIDSGENKGIAQLLAKGIHFIIENYYTTKGI